ncbi:MAG: hypothetical protein RLZZ501_1655 [Pseudomonadota bacterium]
MLAGPAGAEEIVGPAHVVDGDSLDVAGQSVRLFGIDAPEWSQLCHRDGADWAAGRAAAVWLRARAEGKPVRCVVEDEDGHYHRRVATCHLGRRDLNRAIVAAGWAVAYRRYSDRYVGAEAAARAAARGIWRGECDPPEEWRRAHPHEGRR